MAPPNLNTAVNKGAAPELSGLPTSAPTPTAPPGARVVVAFLAGRTTFGLAHLIGAARDLPIPWYHPFERAFVFGPRPAGFAMEWYGRSLTSALVAAAVTTAVWLLAGRRPLAAALSRRSFVIPLAQAAALALLVDFTYFAWIFLTQAASPLPLPPGCVR